MLRKITVFNELFLLFPYRVFLFSYLVNYDFQCNKKKNFRVLTWAILVGCSYFLDTAHGQDDLHVNV